MVSTEAAQISKPNRNIPRVDPQELAQDRETPSVYIWNVSPREFIESRGSLGRFVIPACPEGQPISKPLVIDGWLREAAVDSQDGGTITYKWLRTNGRKLAEDLIGIGMAKHPSQRYAQFGVFISAGPEPTKAEVDAARSHLNSFYSDLVRQADEKFEVNGGIELDEKGVPRQAITRDHVQAGKALKLDRKWLRSQGEMMLCENCGKSNVPTASRCVACSAVFDEAKDRRLFPRDYGEVRRGPGRPKAEAEAAA